MESSNLNYLLFEYLNDNPVKGDDLQLSDAWAKGPLTSSEADINNIDEETLADFVLHVTRKPTYTGISLYDVICCCI